MEFEEAHVAALDGSSVSSIHQTRLGMAEAHISLGHHVMADSLLTVSQQAFDAGADTPTLRQQLDSLQAMLVQARGEAGKN